MQLSVGRDITYDNQKKEIVTAETSVDVWITNVKLWDTYTEVKKSYVNYNIIERR